MRGENGEKGRRVNGYEKGEKRIEVGLPEDEDGNRGTERWP